MVKFSIPLPEICVEDFEHSWTKFRLAVAANKWEKEKELTVLPTLLRGKLVEYYVSLEDEKKADPETLRKALMDRAGISKDPYRIEVSLTFLSLTFQRLDRYFDNDRPLSSYE